MDFLSATLLALFVVGYLILAGSDIGLGMLMPWAARTPEQRRRVVAAIAPYFLASEVWLVAAVGVLAGMFPSLEHHVVTTLWPVFVALLAGWLLRDSGLWFRARVDTRRWRSSCDGAIITGSWILAMSWGLALAGLLTTGLTASLFTLVCVPAVVALFTLRGAAFGAERLAVSGTCESADMCGQATRPLSRVGVVLTGAATAAALLPGGVVSTAPLVSIGLALVVLAALILTSGVTGPMLSRHTSAVAIAVPGVLVALTAELPISSIPGTTGLFVWSMLIPAIPVMFIGQVQLYRMTRRPATEPSFFA